MKLITHKDILNLNIKPKTCIDWIDYVVRNKQNCILAPKISIKPFEGTFFNTMPSIVKDENGTLWGGAKIVTRYPNREPSLDSKIILFDAENGEFKAFIDGDWITTMRTGAVAAHSINLFAKSNYQTIGIIGLGNTARATLLCLLENNINKSIIIKLLRYKNQAELFIERFSSFKNIKFEIVESVKDLINGSEVVVSAATYLSHNICDDNFFNEGITLLPIHTRGFSNCDLFFDKVYGDDYGHICHFKYFNSFKSFNEVSRVVNKEVAGRENDKERIIVYNIGISLHDVYYAAKIYEQLFANNLEELNLMSPKSKFWI